jgi:uncharacterized protein (TIGR00255 family)
MRDYSPGYYRMPLQAASRRAYHEARAVHEDGRQSRDATMIYSMTGYASATREVASEGTGANGSGVGVSVELRTVNSRFLDMNFRMPEDVRACEPQLREMLMSKLSRGKVDIRINLNRAEQSANAGSLNRDALVQLAALEQAVLDVFPNAERMRTGEILRWTGVLS